jgi:hypothetical protein
MADDDQFEDALDESGRLRLYTACPAGHPTIQAFTPGEWREGLAMATIRFECFYCGARWTPSTIQCGAILAELEP